MSGGGIQAGVSTQQPAAQPPMQASQGPGGLFNQVAGAQPIAQQQTPQQIAPQQTKQQGVYSPYGRYAGMFQSTFRNQYGQPQNSFQTSPNNFWQSNNIATNRGGK